MTAGFVGILMTIICCKTLCEFLLELSQPALTQPPPLQGPRAEGSTVLEMPIVIRIYMPQQGAGAAVAAVAAGAAALPTVTVVPVSATADQATKPTKHAFAPLPT